jgi:phage terminase large subunit
MIIQTGYTPRLLQSDIHRNMRRWNVLVCHRRFGKTVLAVNELIDRAVRCTLPNPRFAYIAPFFVQAKTVAWDYLLQFTRAIPGVKKNESELRVDLPNGSRISLYGGDNPDRLRGLYFDAIVLDEMADMEPRLLPEIIRPALSDRRGVLIAIGTPKGRNAFYDMYEAAKGQPEWFAATFKASETGVVAADELEDIRRMLSAEQYEQEMECSFDAAIQGAYWGKELADAEASGRMCEFDAAEGPVHVAWDLGVGDSTALWFWQAIGKEVRILDFYENHGQGLPHYASVIASKPWPHGFDWVPHDARVRELGTGRTRVETMGSLGLKPRLVPGHKVDDGINAVRTLIPHMWFAMPACRDAVEGLKQYRTDYDEKLRIFKDTPRHDWTSHRADALRYLAMAYREIVPAPVKPPPPILAVGSGNQVTMEDLWPKKRRRRD